MSISPLEQKITEIVEPVVQDLGFALFSVSMNGETLQIMAENPDTRNLNLDECSKLSREISAILDVEDPITGRYRLELSSPGIDRPLRSVEDFDYYKGQEAKVELDELIDGRKKFRGEIVGLEEDNVVLKTDEGEVAFPFQSVHKAKLVLTDALIKATKKNVKQSD